MELVGASLEKMTVSVMTEPDSPPMRAFYSECRALGFQNNISPESIKYKWATEENKGRFWTVSVGPRVVAMAGCHWLPQLHENAFRIQFRGCELPGSDLKKTLSRSHFNASTFRELIPHQIEWTKRFPNSECYISVNHDNPNHRAMELIERQGFLTYVTSMELFYTQQTIWKFNEQHYMDVRKKIKVYSD
jgi:hypothetical protein